MLSADNRRAEYAAYSQFISQLDNVSPTPTPASRPRSTNSSVRCRTSPPTRPKCGRAPGALSTAIPCRRASRTLDGRISEIAEGVETEMRSTLEHQRLRRDRRAQRAHGDLAHRRRQFRPPTICSTSATRRSPRAQPPGQGEHGGAARRFDVGLHRFRAGLVMGNRGKAARWATSSTNGRPMTVRANSGRWSRSPETSSMVASSAACWRRARRHGPRRSAASALLATTLATEFNRQHALGLDLEGRLGRFLQDRPKVRVDPSDNGLSVRSTPGRSPRSPAATTRCATTRVTDRHWRRARRADAARDRADGSTGTIRAQGSSSPARGAPGSGQSGLRLSHPPPRGRTRRWRTGTRAPSRWRRQCWPVRPGATATRCGSTNPGRAQPMAVRRPAPHRPARLKASPRWTSASNSTQRAGHGQRLATLAYAPATSAAGKSFTLGGPEASARAQDLRHPAANGSVIALADNKGSVADNRNAALLGACRPTSSCSAAAGSTTATLNNAYARLVAKVGSKTREVQAGERAPGARWSPGQGFARRGLRREPGRRRPTWCASAELPGGGQVMARGAAPVRRNAGDRPLRREHHARIDQHDLRPGRHRPAKTIRRAVAYQASRSPPAARSSPLLDDPVASARARCQPVEQRQPAVHHQPGLCRRCAQAG